MTTKPLAEKLVAHRGLQNRFPENTLLSMTEAIKAGARNIEMDIQLSADQVPVLYHDRTLNRTSDVNGEIHEYAIEDLLNIPAHEPGRFGTRFVQQPITPLAAMVKLLQENPEVHAFVEIKDDAIEIYGNNCVFKRVTRLLAPVEKQCTLIGFDQAFIAYCRAQGWPSVGPVVRHWDECSGQRFTSLAPEFVFCDVKTLPGKGDLQLPPETQSVIYEIDQPAVARQLFSRGIDLIETFDIKGMLEKLSTS